MPSDNLISAAAVEAPKPVDVVDPGALEGLLREALQYVLEVAARQPTTAARMERTQKAQVLAERITRTLTRGAA